MSQPFHYHTINSPFSREQKVFEVVDEDGSICVTFGDTDRDLESAKRITASLNAFHGVALNKIKRAKQHD